MSIVEIKMPKMGESIIEATILKWLKNIGDHITEEEAIIEIATDKVETEIYSTHAGILEKKLYQEGDTIAIGNIFAHIKNTDSSTRDIITKDSIKNSEKKEEKNYHDTPKEQSRKHFYSPLVKQIVKKENISKEELESIRGTGREERVTKNDILRFMQSRPLKENNTLKNPPFNTKITSQPILNEEGDEIIEMSRVRKLIAERMVSSKQISPHVTSFVEADITNIVKWRKNIKDRFRQKHSIDITFMAFFVESIVRSIKDYPLLNASIQENKIIIRKNINIGIAVATPNNELIVPVIHNADHLSLEGIAIKINDIVTRARNEKLKSEDLERSTYTISNVGTFDNIMGTPIIMQPQVAIMAFGTIKKKPVVIESQQGDSIAIRHMIYLSHSYDHRIIDGYLGGSFVKKVAAYIEEFDTTRTI